MNTPNQLDRALEALRHEHRSIAPPPSLAASILGQAPRQIRSVRNWSLAIATAAALTIAIVLLVARPSHPTNETRATTPRPPHPAQAPATRNTPTIASSAPSTHQRASARPRFTPTRHLSSALNPDPFVPLPAGVGLPEPTEAMLIRTRIDTSSFPGYGLAPLPPGAPETVLAEFLIGEDGLPRAIRLVP